MAAFIIDDFKWIYSKLTNPLTGLVSQFVHTFYDEQEVTEGHLTLRRKQCVDLPVLIKALSVGDGSLTERCDSAISGLMKDLNEVRDSDDYRMQIGQPELIGGEIVYALRLKSAIVVVERLQGFRSTHQDKIDKVMRLSDETFAKALGGTLRGFEFPARQDFFSLLRKESRRECALAAQGPMPKVASAAVPAPAEHAAQGPKRGVASAAVPAPAEPVKTYAFPAPVGAITDADL